MYTSDSAALHLAELPSNSKGLAKRDTVPDDMQAGHAVGHTFHVP